MSKIKVKLKNSMKKNNFFLYFFIFFVLNINLTKAQLPNPLGSDNLMTIINRFLIFIIYNIAPILVTLMVLVGAYQIMFSMGNPESFKKGKKTIIYAIVGYVIIFLSYGIVKIIEDIVK